MQLSTSFILPLFKFSDLILNSYTKTYMGHTRYEAPRAWGNYFYLQITSELLDGILLEDLRNHPQYEAEIDEVDFVFFVFRFTPIQKQKIVKPFLQGKYSEIDREYVRTHFPKYLKNGNISLNWRILVKDDWEKPTDVYSLRSYWLQAIGQQLPEDSEVWSKPQREKEIYGYVDLDGTFTSEKQEVSEGDNTFGA